MKNIFMAFMFCLVSIIVFGQNEEITYSQIVEGKSAKELTGHNSGRLIHSYMASNGITYTKGIEIELGEPSEGNKFYTCIKYGLENVRSDRGAILTIDKIYCLRKSAGCRIRIDFTNGAYIEDFELAIEKKELNIAERIITEFSKGKDIEEQQDDGSNVENSDTTGVITIYPTAWRQSVIDCTQFSEEKKPFLISRTHWEDWDAGVFMHKAQEARWIGVGTGILLGTASAICYVADAAPAGQWFAIFSGVSGFVGFVVSEIRFHAASHKMSRIGLNPNGILIRLNK